MRFSPSSVGFVPLLLSRTLAAPSDLRSRDLNAFVTAERAIALQGALNNIGPSGSAVPGAGSGFVVASPSKVNPDCEFFAISEASREVGTDFNRLLHMDQRLGSDSEDADR
jgi:glucoamylase